MRFMFAALLWLITLSIVDVASAETLQELTTLCQKGDAEACSSLGYRYDNGTGVRLAVARSPLLHFEQIQTPKENRCR